MRLKALLADEPKIERFVRFIFLWSVFQLQAVTDGKDDTSDNPPVVDARNVTHQREE